MIGALITLFVLCIVGLVLFAVVLSVLAAVFGLAVKVLPLLLVGWLAVKLIRRAERPRSVLPVPVRPAAAHPLTRADEEWLDS